MALLGRARAGGAEAVQLDDPGVARGQHDVGRLALGDLLVDVGVHRGRQAHAGQGHGAVLQDLVAVGLIGHGLRDERDAGDGDVDRLLGDAGRLAGIALAADLGGDDVAAPVARLGDLAAVQRGAVRRQGAFVVVGQAGDVEGHIAAGAEGEGGEGEGGEGGGEEGLHGAGSILI